MLAWLDNPRRTTCPLLVRQGRKIILRWKDGPLHIDDRSWDRSEKNAQLTAIDPVFCSGLVVHYY
jgi:hypothetical protein